jgi:hypothetical protein
VDFTPPSPSTLRGVWPVLSIPCRLDVFILQDAFP